MENSTGKKLNANTRRKSLFDKISDYILKTFTSSEEHNIQVVTQSTQSTSSQSTLLRRRYQMSVSEATKTEKVPFSALR